MTAGDTLAVTHCIPDQASSIGRPGFWRRITRKIATAIGCSTISLALVAGMASAARAETGGYIVFDVATGEIFARHNADQAWYPASITKLMTTYVVFQMIKAGKLSFNSPVVMSAAAASQPPSKMGFPVGTVITIDNALKMIMVKSANDVAWAIGESVGGSRQAFVALMNDYAHRIGMTETSWDNPNGLPDPNNMTTAHDMGLLARALLREFPDYDFYFRLPGIQLGNRVIPNHNHLMDHYPGADGMKTGYICAAGFNVVASATRNGHRMVAVVLGARAARPRAELAAELFNRAFERVGSSNLFSFGQVDSLDSYRPGPEANQPVGDIHAEVCGGKRNTGSDEAIDDAVEPAAANSGDNGRLVPPGAQQRLAHAELLSPHFNIGPPVKVWLGGADPIGPRTAALVDAPASTTPALPKAPIPVTVAPNKATAGPRVRAPGAVLPLTPPAQTDASPAPAQANAPPEQTPPAQETPIVRAFTLFQPPPPPAASPRSDDAATVTEPIIGTPPRPDPAADATSLKVPVPKQRPAVKTHSAEANTTTPPTKSSRPQKSAKTKKPVKPTQDD